MTENALVSWDERLAAEASAEARAASPEIGTFSFKSGILSYDGNTIPGGNIDIVILAGLYENRYFPEEYDANNVQSPLCWAFGEDKVGLAPDPELVTKAMGTDCESCEMGQWGSDPKGRGGKACKNVRRFICISANELDRIPEAHFAMGVMSTTNRKHWETYVNRLAATVKRPAWTVITKLTCAPDQKTIVRLSFDLVTPINADLLGELDEKRQRAIELIAKPYEKRPADWDAPKEPKKNRKY